MLWCQTCAGGRSKRFNETLGLFLGGAAVRCVRLWSYIQNRILSLLRGGGSRRRDWANMDVKSSFPIWMIYLLLPSCQRQIGLYCLNSLCCYCLLTPPTSAGSTNHKHFKLFFLCRESETGEGQERAETEGDEQRLWTNMTETTGMAAMSFLPLTPFLVHHLPPPLTSFISLLIISSPSLRARVVQKGRRKRILPHKTCTSWP